jgi:hypothetical protein
MAKTIEKAIFGVLMVLVLGIGSVFVTAIAANTNPVGWASSIRVADSGDVNVPEVSEAEESVQLATLNGLITPEEAQAYAIKAVDDDNIAHEFEGDEGDHED